MRDLVSECTRQPPHPGDESADLVPGQRSFDEHAVADILRRAAALERRHPGGLGELTQDELEEIARDSGIEPSLVRRAIQERDEQAVPSTGSWLAGAMTTAFLIQAADMSPLVAVPAGLGAFLGVTAGAWALARALFRSRALPVHRRLAALAERLEDRLRRRAERPAP